MASSTQFVPTLVALILFQLLIGNISHQVYFDFSSVCLYSLWVCQKHAIYRDSKNSNIDAKHAV